MDLTQLKNQLNDETLFWLEYDMNLKTVYSDEIQTAKDNGEFTIELPSHVTKSGKAELFYID